MFPSNLSQRVCGNNMVPEASRTKQTKQKKKRTTAFVVVLSCWRYLFSRARRPAKYRGQMRAELTCHGMVPEASRTKQRKQKKKRTAAFVVVLSCWRYLFSRAVSSQVSWAEASLTSVFGMGTGGPSP